MRTPARNDAPPPHAPRDAGSPRWTLASPRGPLELGGRPRLVGVVNATPDSFYDGGRHARLDEAFAHAERLLEEGADWLDVGGESTRPGAETVSEEEELRRVVRLVERLSRACAAPISIDTRKSAVARAALDAGAWIVNDVSGGTHDPEMAPLVAARRAPLVVNHMRGDPKSMQDAPSYGDPVREVIDELAARLAALADAGVDPAATLVDPGLGFGKRLSDNVAILRRLPELRALGRPVFVGPSRKAFIGALLGGRPPQERLFGTAAAVAAAVAGGAAAIRVHDAAAMRDVIAVAAAIASEPEEARRE